jgi:uncharacterized membrane protein YphA (DoxX/SURF4 family)
MNREQTHMVRRFTKLVSHPLFLAILRVALGVVFISASVDKIMNPQNFAANIANYRLIPYQWINLAAIILPWVEVIIGSLLVMGIWTGANGLLASGMLMVFSIAILQALFRNLDISCGCFSTDPSAHKMTRWTFIWDLIWLSWGLAVVFLDRGRFSLGEILGKTRRKEGA